MSKRLDEAKQRVRAALRDPVALAAALGLAGRAEGSAFLCHCPWHDEKTPSCRLSLGPDDTVRVKCFGCNHGDDGLGLVARVKGLDIKTDFPAVLEAAAAIAGVQLDGSAPPPARRKAFQAPVEPAAKTTVKVAPPLPAKLAEDYHAALLANGTLLERVCQSRCLTIETIKRAKLGFCAERRKAPNGCLTIPYFADGKLVSIKYKKPQPAGPNGVRPKDEYEREPGNARKVLYGIDWLQPGPQVVICEGELDALVLQQEGINAVSIPDGAGSAGEKGHELAWLDPVETYADIVLAMDADQAGREAAALLGPRLPPERLRVAEWPDEHGKDPTDFARANRLGLVAEAIRAAKRFEHPLFQTAAGALAELIDSYDGGRGRRVLPTGIRGLDSRIGGGLLYGELILIFGHPKSGKSSWANDLHFRVIDNLREWCLVASVEMPTREWMGRLVRRKAGAAWPDLSGPEKRRVIEWAESLPLLFVRARGRLELDRLIEAMEYARRRYDCRVAVIDHLQKLMVANEDSERGWQELDEITDRLQTVAQNHDICTMLLSHTSWTGSASGKGKGKDDANPLPAMNSGRGFKGIAGNAAVVIGVWRDRSTSGPIGTSKIGCLAFRDPGGDENFWVELEYDRRSLTYTEKGGDGPEGNLPLDDPRLPPERDDDDIPSRGEF